MWSIRIAFAASVVALLQACGGGGGAAAPTGSDGSANPGTSTPSTSTTTASTTLQTGIVLLAGDPGGSGNLDGPPDVARFTGLGSISATTSGIYAGGRLVRWDRSTVTDASIAGGASTTDPAGNLYFVRSGVQVWKKTPAGQVTLLPVDFSGLPLSISAISADGAGNLDVMVGYGLYRVSPNGAKVLLAVSTLIAASSLSPLGMLAGEGLAVGLHARRLAERGQPLRLADHGVHGAGDVAVAGGIAWPAPWGRPGRPTVRAARPASSIRW